MVPQQNPTRSARKERIDVSYDYAVCAWARHFNVSERRVKEAVAAVGNEAEKVREHLRRTAGSERPSA
jgi:predicted nucleotidyltransferase